MDVKGVEGLIKEMRAQIEALDRKVLELLDKRMSLVETVGKAKALLGLPIEDRRREEELLQKLCSAPTLCLDPEEIRGFFQVVFGLSVLKQMRFFHASPKGPFKVCVSLLPKDQEELEEALVLCEKKKVEMLELRLDRAKGSLCLGDGRRPEGLVLTNRRRAEGGFFKGEEKERIWLLKEYMRRLSPDYVDLEWLTPEGLKEDLIAEKGKAKVILSYHHLDGTPDPQVLMELLWRMSEDGADVYKVVTMAHKLEDSLKVLYFLMWARSEGFEVIGHAMGRWGKLSRILSPLFGAPFAYAALSWGKEAAPGQMTPEELRLSWTLLGRWLADA